MASSLLALLTQQTPHLQTRKGLILLGLQNDFLSPDGKLPVSTESGFLDRLKELVHGFREFGDVIWVRSEFEASRTVNAPDESGDSVIIGEANEGLYSEPQGASDSAHCSDPDEELFLTRTTSKEPCCVPGSVGAEYAVQIKELVDPQKDMEVVKTYYSAFGSTSLLLALRSRMITELYVCGCNTNLSVFATAMDAARYGISITLVEDCLGYRRRDRHEEAIRQLREIMEADVTTSENVLHLLRHPTLEADDEDADEDENDNDDDKHEAQPHARDLLAVASDDEDEDDDDFDLLTVRSSRVSLRSIAPSSVRSRRIASKSAPTQHAESTRTQYPPDPRRAAVSIVEAGDRPKRRAGKDGIGSAMLPASSVRGVRGVGSGTTKSEHKEDSTSSSRSSPLGPVAPCADARDKTPEEVRHTADSTHNMRTSQSRPLFGTDKENVSAGSRIYYDLLPPELASTVFDRLNKEVDWQRMHHQTGEVPRLVCCQGTIDLEDGSKPLYRHPSDQTLPSQPFTPTVEKVKEAAEGVVGHTLNHVLIQLYRGGTDYISEHSDKTLDIVPGSQIVNVSFGAQRTMRFRTKRAVASTTASPKQRTTYRVPMPHNSMLTMSLATNAEYLHGIMADKRPASEHSDAETAYSSQRISLTFRHIGTFLSADDRKIWGQGAVGKTKQDARPVINGDAAESEKLVRAFGADNQASSIQWEEVYGQGSDVLHLK